MSFEDNIWPFAEKSKILNFMKYFNKEKKKLSEI